MESLKRVLSFVSRGSANDPMDLPRSVLKAFVLEKDVGHRGPVIGGYLMDTFDGLSAACTVTPTGATIVNADNGQVVSIVKPSDIGTDAFTCVALMSLSEAAAGDPKECGLVLCCQSGRVMLVQISKCVTQKIIAQSEISSCAITAVSVAQSLPSVVILGTEDGRVLLWDSVNHPSIAAVSVTASASPISSLLVTRDNTVYAAADGVMVYTISGAVPSLSLEQSGSAIHFEGMNAITSLGESTYHNLLISLSSCLEVFLIDRTNRDLVHQYPASLMTCGAPLSVMSTVEFENIPGSTFLVLGGVDGSLCLRELSKRPRDEKLQCVLHRCFDRLTPQPRSLADLPLDPSEGCPITSLYTPTGDNEVCVVGDAGCSVFVVRFLYQSAGSVSPPVEQEPERPEDDKETATEISGALSKRASLDEVVFEDRPEEPGELKIAEPDDKVSNS